MDKLGSAIGEFNRIDDMAGRNQWVNKLHPLIKFILTVIYICTVVSFNKYDVLGVMGMCIYPLCMFILAELSFKESLKKIWAVLPLVCFVGLLNPIFDRNMVQIGDMVISAGILSMISLIIKGICTVYASYILVTTTTIEKLCYSFRLMHIPQIMVTQIMFIYRYLGLLLNEAHCIIQAYSLRAPGQKGVQFKVWGPLVGQLLLKSMDRADDIYASMQLRGFDGNYAYIGECVRVKVGDIMFLVFWLAVFLVFRQYPVLWMVGNFF